MRSGAEDSPVMVLECDGRFGTEVRGESHYQSAIADCIAGLPLTRTSPSSCQCDFVACLVREPNNRHDRNAIIVASVAGKTLGYLPRELAVEFASILDRLDRSLQFQCPGRAYGRQDDSTERWNFGVWLDLPDPDDLSEALGDLDSAKLAEMRRPEGLLRYRDHRSGDLVSGVGSDGRRDSNYDPVDQKLTASDSFVSVTCPVCGSAEHAARGIGGFRCRAEVVRDLVEL